MNKYWISGTSGNFSDNSKWSTTSGGGNNTTAPSSSDVANFDGNGLGNCTLSANTTIQKLLIGSGYQGVFDCSTFNLIATDNTGSVVSYQGSSPGSLKMGSGTHTIGGLNSGVGGGDFVVVSPTTGSIDMGTCTINVYGKIDNVFAASAAVAVWTLNALGTGSGSRAIQLKIPTSGVSAGTINILGDGYKSTITTSAYNLSIDPAKTFYMSNLFGNPTLFIINTTGATGLSMGTGAVFDVINDNGANAQTATLIISQNASIAAQEGSITSAISLEVRDGNNTIAPGNYSCPTKIGATSAGSFSYSLAFSSGTYTFNSDVTFYSGPTTGVASAGTFSYSNNGATLIFNKGFTFFKNTGGTLNWTRGTTGGIELDGTSGTYNTNLYNIALSNLTINCAGATRNITGTNVRARSLTISSGTVTITADALTVDGNLTISGSGSVAIDTPTIAVAGDWDTHSATNFTLSPSTVTFSGTTGTIQTSSTVGLDSVIISSGKTYSIGVEGVIIGDLTLNGSLSIDGPLTYTGNNLALNVGSSLIGASDLEINNTSLSINGSWKHSGTLTIKGSTSISSSSASITFDGPVFFIQNSGTPTVNINTDIVFYDDVTFNQNVAGSNYTIKMNNKNFVFKKGLSLIKSSGSNLVWRKGTGVFLFNGDEDQNIKLSGVTIEEVLIDATGSVIFTDDGTVSGFVLKNGNVDFDRNEISVAGDFSIEAGGTVSTSTLGGTALLVGGDFAVTGTSSTLLDLRASSAWTIVVSGDATASFVNVRNSHATGGSLIRSDSTCIDSGGNTGWGFSSPTAGVEIINQGLPTTQAGFNCSQVIPEQKKEIITRVTWKFVNGAYVPVTTVCTDFKLKSTFL